MSLFQLLWSVASHFGTEVLKLLDRGQIPQMSIKYGSGWPTTGHKCTRSTNLVVILLPSALSFPYLVLELANPRKGHLSYFHLYAVSTRSIIPWMLIVGSWLGRLYPAFLSKHKYKQELLQRIRPNCQFGPGSHEMEDTLHSHLWCPATGIHSLQLAVAYNWHAASGKKGGTQPLWLLMLRSESEVASVYKQLAFLRNVFRDKTATSLGKM